MDAAERIAALAREIAERQRRGQVVFTNGCFDLLHPGHVEGLRRARALGDALVVAVNSDASVRELKGAGRPIVPLRERVEMLEAIRWVDWAVPFEGSSPTALIRSLRPAIYVKGADWRDRPLPERSALEAIGARVEYLDLHGAYSTTALVERVRAIPLDLATEREPPG